MSAVETPRETLRRDDTISQMGHALGFDTSKKLCGAPHDGSPARGKRDPECVVCADIWMGMNPQQQEALIVFWGV